MNTERTLSGIDSNSVNQLFLPSAVASLIIGGDIGESGQVLCKASDNKLHWDFVDDIEIPDHTISGDKLKRDITFATSGNITLYRDPALNAGIARLTTQELFATIDLLVGSTTRKVEVDASTGNVIQYESYTDDNNNNEYFSVKNGIVAMRGATLGGNSASENKFTLTNTGTIEIQGLVDGVQTQLFDITGANIVKVKDITSSGLLKSTRALTESGVKVYGLDITGNAKIGGDLEVTGDITLDDITVDDVTIGGLMRFQHVIAGVDPLRIYLDINSNGGDMSWYKDYDPNAGSPDTDKIASITRDKTKTPNEIKFETNGRIISTQPNNGALPSLSVQGFSQFFGRLAMSFITTTLASGTGIFCNTSINIGKFSSSNPLGISCGGNQELIGSDKSGAIDHRTFIITNTQDGDAPSDPPTVKFKIDNDSITVCKNITCTGIISASEYDFNGDLVLEGSDKTGLVDHRKIKIENLQNDDTKLTVFEIDNDDIIKVKDITSTGDLTIVDIISTGDITTTKDIIISNTDINNTDIPLMRIDGSFQMWNKLGNVQVIQFDPDLLTAYMNNSLRIRGALSTGNGEILTLGGSGLGYTNTDPAYRFNTGIFSNVGGTNGTRKKQVIGYGQDVSANPITSWIIEIFDDEGDNTATPPRPANTSHSRATFDVLKIKGDLTENSEIKGALNFKTKTSISTEGVDFRTFNDNYATQVISIEPNRRPIDIDSLYYGLTEFNCCVNFFTAIDSTGQNLQNPIVSFGSEADGLEPLKAPISIQNVNKARANGDKTNAGGIVFGTTDPAIRGHSSKTLCYNLDLNDASNSLPTSVLDPHDSLCRLAPSVEEKWPDIDFNDPTVDFWYNWFFQFKTGEGGTNEGNGIINDNWLLSIPSNAIPDSKKMKVGYSIYVEERWFGDDSGASNGNRDMYLRWNFTSSQDGYKKEVAYPSKFLLSGLGQYKSGGSNVQNGAIRGGGYVATGEQIITLPNNNYSFRVFPRFSNKPEGNNTRAFIQFAFGGGRQDALLWSTPIPSNYTEIIA